MYLFVQKAICSNWIFTFSYKYYLKMFSKKLTLYCISKSCVDGMMKKNDLYTNICYIYKHIWLSIIQCSNLKIFFVLYKQFTALHSKVF